MTKWERVERWIKLSANLAVLAGIVLILMQLTQNTEHLRLQLVDQINSRLYENNRALLGEDPVEAIEKSVLEPESMTFSDFLIVDVYLFNALNGWEDLYRLYQADLVEADAWQSRVDGDVVWYFGNRFAKNWWIATGSSFFEGEFAEYVDGAIRSVSENETLQFFERSRVQETIR